MKQIMVCQRGKVVSVMIDESYQKERWENMSPTQRFRWLTKNLRMYWATAMKYRRWSYDALKRVKGIGGVIQRGFVTDPV